MTLLTPNTWFPGNIKSAYKRDSRKRSLPEFVTQRSNFSQYRGGPHLAAIKITRQGPQMRALAMSIACIAIAGCTTVEPPPPVEPPKAWAQKPEELGKLPAGIVLSKTLETYDASRYVPPSIEVPIMIPINGIFIPVTAPSMRTKLHSRHQQFYRYQIKGKDWPEPLYWDDFVLYDIGACVAFRSEISMMVPAAPKACD